MKKETLYRLALEAEEKFTSAILEQFGNHQGRWEPNHTFNEATKKAYLGKVKADKEFLGY